MMTTESKISNGDLEKLSGDPGAAFPFPKYPSRESIWVEHVLTGRGGSKVLECVRCGLREDAKPPVPDDAPEFLMNFFVCWTKAQACKYPRASFVVACGPYFSPLPRLQFLEGVTI